MCDVVEDESQERWSPYHLHAFASFCNKKNDVHKETREKNLLLLIYVINRFTFRCGKPLSGSRYDHTQAHILEFRTPSRSDSSSLFVERGEQERERKPIRFWLQ